MSLCKFNSSFTSSGSKYGFNKYSQKEHDGYFSSSIFSEILVISEIQAYSPVYSFKKYSRGGLESCFNGLSTSFASWRSRFNSSEPQRRTRLSPLKQIWQKQAKKKKIEDNRGAWEGFEFKRKLWDDRSPSMKNCICSAEPNAACDLCPMLVTPCITVPVHTALKLMDSRAKCWISARWNWGVFSLELSVLDLCKMTTTAPVLTASGWTYPG